MSGDLHLAGVDNDLFRCLMYRRFKAICRSFRVEVFEMYPSFSGSAMNHKNAAAARAVTIQLFSRWQRIGLDLSAIDFAERNL